ncbi:DUF433 domain-containing protein [Halobium salinum]|uniref:DUF433 domain-containing protein n=1 Tax=Halobium salinum TaxID=1364940 RepID=A0ABD5P8L2_9EURY|nr:DUF433 domain-containing protein [Halobium salinum]
MNRIVHTPVPTVDDTDVRVVDVVRAYEFLKFGPEDIAHKYGLTVEQVEDALAYYYEYPEEFGLVAV